MRKTLSTLSFIVGIVGIFLAIYFHNSTKEKKEITFYNSPESFKIYDNDLLKESQKISLYKNDTIKINENVFLTTFSIWNSGNMEINPVDVRKKVLIEYNGIIEILDFSIIKEIDHEVSEFKLNQISPCTFELDWKYFDPADGIKFQLLYIGESDIKGEVTGKVLKTKITEFNSIRDKKDTIPLMIFGTLITIILALIIFGLYREHIENKFFRKLFLLELKNKIFRKIIRVVFLIFLICYLILVPYMFYIYFFQDNGIPF